jgi:hypothetical protein
MPWIDGATPVAIDRLSGFGERRHRALRRQRRPAGDEFLKRTALHLRQLPSPGIPARIPSMQDNYCFPAASI